MNRRQLTGMAALGLALALTASRASWADDQKFDGYTVHYNAFPADFLTPQVAKSYGIRRSKNRGVLNITVTEAKPEGALPAPVEADINARAVNVYQQVKPMKIRKVAEGEAIYYIAEFPIANQEMLNFEVNASRNGKDIGKVKFQKQFFTE